MVIIGKQHPAGLQELHSLVSADLGSHGPALNRQSYDELTAEPWAFAMGRDRPTVKLGQAFCKGESDSRSPFGALQRGLQLYAR